MGVKFNKSGIIEASGIIVGANLIIDSLNKSDSHLTSGNEYMAIDVGDSYKNIADGTIVTISFDLECKFLSGSNNNIIYVYNTNNHGPKTFTGVTWNFIDHGYSIGDTIKQRVSVTTTIHDRSSSDINKTSNYIEFYTGYNTGNVFAISNLKCEIGSIATPWIPNVNDWGYIGDSPHGFIEITPKMKLYNGKIETSEFIEW